MHDSRNRRHPTIRRVASRAWHRRYGPRALRQAMERRQIRFGGHFRAMQSGHLASILNAVKLVAGG